MASGTYNLNLLPHRFSIGRQGENRYRKVSFDVYKFVEPVFRDSADGVIFLVGVFRRPDNTVYNAIVEKIDRNDFDNVIDWYPTITETYYAGEGSLQFVISKMPVTGDTTVPEEYILGKSNVAQVTIEESSTESGPLPPTPDAPIQVTVTEDVDAAKKAATVAESYATHPALPDESGYYKVWNAETKEYDITKIPVAPGPAGLMALFVPIQKFDSPPIVGQLYNVTNANFNREPLEGEESVCYIVPTDAEAAKGANWLCVCFVRVDVIPVPNREKKYALMIEDMYSLTSGGGSGDGNLKSDDFDRIKVMDRGEYEALETKDPRTAYFIRG